MINQDKEQEKKNGELEIEKLEKIRQTNLEV